MSLKQITPLKKHYSKIGSKPSVRLSLKMLYINSAAMELLGCTEYIHMSLDLDNRRLIISKSEQDDTSFKLSTVCHTQHARRIETNRALITIIKNGFPLYMVDKPLPVTRLLDGSIVADFSMPVPLTANSMTAKTAIAG